MNLKTLVNCKTWCSMLSLVAVLVFAGCASFPTMESSGSGRLLVFSRMDFKGGSGPWWNYQIFAKNIETGEKVVLNISTGRQMSYHLSKEIPPGEYQLYEWNSVSKKTSKAYDHDLSGNFLIQANAITVFDKELVVTQTSDSQAFDFSPRSGLFRDEQVANLKESHPELDSWGIFWEKTDDVRF